MHHVSVEESKKIVRQRLAWILCGLKVLTIFSVFRALTKAELWMAFRRHRIELNRSGNVIRSPGRVILDSPADVEGICEPFFREGYNHVVTFAQVYSEIYTREVWPIAYQFDHCSSDQETQASARCCKIRGLNCSLHRPLTLPCFALYASVHSFGEHLIPAKSRKTSDRYLVDTRELPLREMFDVCPVAPPDTSGKQT